MHQKLICIISCNYYYYYHYLLLLLYFESLFSILNMFDFFFGWRKASKCKKLIKRVQCRLKLLKNKRQSIVRNLRQDMAQLIKYDHVDIAFNRVEQLIRDENMVAVYELLDHFCEFILVHLSYIRRHKDCPNDINEAVSSLIFASARCGDLPELPAIRNLFGERYGHKFAMSAAEVFPGNLVNHEVQEKLSQQSISEDEKHRLVNEIAREYCPRPEILALEYYSEWQQQLQVMNNNGNEEADTDIEAYPDIPERSEQQASNVGIEKRLILVDSSAKTNVLIKPSLSLSHSNVNVTSKAMMDSTSLEHTQDIMISGSSSENLPLFPEETLVYLDDIEEFQSSIGKDEVSQDQRIFKVKYETRDEKSGSSCNSYVNGATEYQIFTYPDQYKANVVKQNKETKEEAEEFDCKESFASSTTCCSSSSWIKKEIVPPYLRTVTMPPERPSYIFKDDLQRSNSFPFQYPSHVHPKLPDYDDIAARFMALKKEKLQIKHH